MLHATFVKVEDEIAEGDRRRVGARSFSAKGGAQAGEERFRRDRFMRKSSAPASSAITSETSSTSPRHDDDGDVGRLCECAASPTPSRRAI
jgi:hypothetical protein